MKKLVLDPANPRASVREFCRSMASDEQPLDEGAYAPSRAEGLARIEAMRPAAYAKSRNYYDGDVTRLSPYLRHGLVTLREALDQAKGNEPKAAEKLIQELAWRDFWQRALEENPQHAWLDIEAYKTGYKPGHYAQAIPEDVLAGETDSAAINHFVRDLTQTGYLHNHARMYLAAYLVHWRHVRWQAGAAWFLEHLLDGDLASNNLSWQWIASTFANKPYYFNLENLAKYCGRHVDCSLQANLPFAGTYEELYERLFPYAEPVA